MKLKSIWINTQSLLYASLTIVGTIILVIAGIALLPVTILLVAIFILFVVYKVVISDEDIS
tara:strand:- start:541 stop:723 length:183 start_codon:yes stop_codon:yes gene_type:complete